MGRVESSAPPIAGEIHIGLDIGQKVDPTALVVVETLDVPSGRTQETWQHYGLADWDKRRAGTQETRYVVRTLERIKLGTGYPEVCARVVEVLVKLRQLELSRRVTSGIDEGGRLTLRSLYVDVTGVGRPVYDILQTAILSQRHAQDCRVYPITFTHGDRYDRKTGSMGKAYLVSRLQVLLQTKRLHLPASHPDVPVLVRELQDYEIRVDSNANDTYGAFRVGTHDDLATALGLACLEDPRDYRVTLVPNPWA
ncbi:MAG TPA: hypothetical protein VFN11_17780 [Ktedonobacterales bacterium]|nr:hypothetical protein [Ktedonobacterales bacterium]